MSSYKVSDDYDDKAATFQVMMLGILNEALKDAGINDKEKRKAICESFGFNFGVFTDQHWFKDTAGNKVDPCVAFSSQGPAADVEEAGLGTVLLPNNSFSWHEYLHGDLDYLFDEIEEDLSKLETGDERA
jgi:hypothetical protein